MLDGCLCYFLVDTCMVHDPTFLWGLCRCEEVDEMLEVGPEIFEDLEDFVKTGKQPFDHVYETLFMHVI